MMAPTYSWLASERFELNTAARCTSPQDGGVSRASPTATSWFNRLVSSSTRPPLFRAFSTGPFADGYEKQMQPTIWETLHAVWQDKYFEKHHVNKWILLRLLITNITDESYKLRTNPFSASFNHSVEWALWGCFYQLSPRCLTQLRLPLLILPPTYHYSVVTK